jgi:hypothetical protein
LEQNQNVLICSRIFQTVFPADSLTTSTGTFLASATLSRPQLTFSGTSSSLSRPLKHLKASMDTLTASMDTLTASTDTLTASKALSRPLQSTRTQLDCNREFTVLSHGCENVVEAVRVLYTLAASLGSPTITMGTITAFISTLMASTGIFMNSTTLTRPTLILMGPCKHSHFSATVS